MSNKSDKDSAKPTPGSIKLVTITIDPELLTNIDPTYLEENVASVFTTISTRKYLLSILILINNYSTLYIINNKSFFVPSSYVLSSIDNNIYVSIGKLAIIGRGTRLFKKAINYSLVSRIKRD